MSEIRRLAVFAFAGALAVAGASPAAATCEAQSPRHRVALLELYTSEGCSSCPPADEWVSALPAAGFGPGQVVPLAFHVDYWDYLGWPDRFADPAFTERQRHLSAANRLGFVYTPELALNGKVFRGLSNQRLREALRRINDEPAPADVSIRATPTPRSVAVQVDARLREGAAADVVLFLALTQNGLVSEVRRGENAGRRLHHDFVVREWRGPFALHAGSAAIRETLPALDPPAPSGAKVVALVQNRATGEVLQALALSLCPPS